MPSWRRIWSRDATKLDQFPFTFDVCDFIGDQSCSRGLTYKNCTLGFEFLTGSSGEVRAETGIFGSCEHSLAMINPIGLGLADEGDQHETPGEN